MTLVTGGELNQGGWICTVGTGVAGTIWSGVLGIACPVAGAIIGLGWALISAWACDKVNDSYEKKESEDE